MQYERLQEPGERTLQETSIGPGRAESEELSKLEHGKVTADSIRLQPPVDDSKSSGKEADSLPSSGDRRMAKKVLSKAYRHRNQRQSHEPENTSAGDEKSIPNSSNEMAQEKGRSQPRRPFRNKSLGDAKADHRVGRRRRSSSKGADGSPPSSPRTRQARRRSKAFRDLLGAGNLIAAQQRQRQRSSSRDKTSSQIGKQPSSQDENSKESLSASSQPQTFRRIRSVHERSSTSKAQKGLPIVSERRRRSIGAGRRIERNKIRSKAVIQEDPSVGSQANASTQSSKTSRGGLRHRSLSSDASRLRSRGRSQDVDSCRRRGITRKASSQSPSRADLRNNNHPRRRRSTASVCNASSEGKVSEKDVHVSKSEESDDRSINSAPMGQVRNSDRSLGQELSSQPIENECEGNDRGVQSAIGPLTGSESLLAQFKVSSRIDHRPKMRGRRPKSDTSVLSSRKQAKEQTSTDYSQVNVKRPSPKSQESSLLVPEEPSSEQPTSNHTLLGVTPCSAMPESEEKSKTEVTLDTEAESSEGIDWDLSTRSEYTEGLVRVINANANSLQTPSSPDHSFSEVGAEGGPGGYLQLCLPSRPQDSKDSLRLQSPERTSNSEKKYSKPGNGVFRRVGQTMRKAAMAKGGWEAHSTHNLN